MLSKLQLRLLVLFLMAIQMHAQREKEPGILEYRLSFKGGEAIITFNVYNIDVIRQLLVISHLVREDMPYQQVDLPLISGRVIHLKLNMDDPYLRLQLKKVADTYEEVFFNKFVITRLKYLGGSILAIFNTAKEDVVAELQRLDEATDEKKYFVEHNFALLNGTNMNVKLNLNEEHVRNALKKVAVKYSETPIEITPNPVSISMPFKKGIAIGIFDVNNLEVINSLRELNFKADETQPYLVKAFRLWNGEKLLVKLNMDNDSVREVLKNIADEYYELPRKTVANLYTLTFADGKAKGTVDLNKEEVINTLMFLDENVDLNEPYDIKRIPLGEGAVIYVRLNTNNPDTIQTLKSIMDDYEVEPVHISDAYEVIDLPYLSNIIRVVVDVGKEDVLQRLRDLSDNVKDELYAVKNIHLQNGTIVPIKLGINNLITLATLRSIAEEYGIIANNTDYRYVSKTLPFFNGNAIAVFDISDSRVIEKLQSLDNRIVNPSHHSEEFRLFNGSLLSVLLNINDPATRETLKDMAVQYEECIEPEVSNYIAKSLTWSGGDAVAVFDVSKPEVIDKLKQLHKNDESIETYEFSLSENSSLHVKFDLENPETRMSLQNLSDEYREHIKPYVPNLITLNLEWEKGRAIGIYDTNKPSVIQGLRDLNDPGGTEIQIVLSDNVKVPIKLNLNDWKTRKVLKEMSEKYEEYVEPYSPHHVTQIMPSKNKMAVGVFDTNNPKVIIQLQNLHGDEEFGQVYQFPLSNGTNVSVTLDLNNPQTVAQLKDIAEKFEETNKSEYVTVSLPFPDGIALAVLNKNKPEVMSGLKDLDIVNEAALNNEGMLPLKTKLKDPVKRKALQKLAEKYEEFVCHQSKFVTKLFSWKHGRMVAVFDTSNPKVISGLSELNDERGKVETFPLRSGKEFSVSLNLDDPNARKIVRNLAEMHKEYVVATLVPQTLEFPGHLASAVYDVSKPRVVDLLQDIASSASEDLPILTRKFPLIDGKPLEFRYNPDNITVRKLLQGLAEYYEEIQEPNYIVASLDFNTGKAAVILDMNQPEVLPTLEKLNAEADLEEPIVSVDIPVHRNKYLHVRLNMENLEVRKTLKNIAEHYKEILYPNRTNLVSFELPFNKGLIKVTIDSFNRDVVEELKMMTQEARADSPGKEILLISRKPLPFKINTDDSQTRQRLENIAVKYKEIAIEQPPEYVIKILPYHSGKLVAVLDVNKRNVIDTLQMLNDMVDKRKPYVKEQLRKSDGSTLTAQLNIDDKSVRELICDVAHECDDIPHITGPKYVTHNMPFDGEMAMATFDVSKVEVIEGLIQLQDKIAEGQHNITRDFPLEDGSVLQVKFDITDLETRRTLQKLAYKYQEIPDPRRPSTVILELPFEGGLIVSTFDVSNDEAIEKLKLLSDSSIQDNLSVDIPLMNGTLLNLNINVNDPKTRNALKDLALEYEDLSDTLRMFKTQKLGDGESTFDFRVAIEKLHKLEQHLGEQDSQVIVKVLMSNGTVTNVKIDPNDPKRLADLAMEHVQILNWTDVDYSEQDLQFQADGMINISDSGVIEKLNVSDNQERKTELYVKMEVVQANGSVTFTSLNFDDPLVRRDLEGIVRDYKQRSFKKFPYHYKYPHYKFPHDEGVTSITLIFDNSEVLKVLEKLYKVESKGLYEVERKWESTISARSLEPDGSSFEQVKSDLNHTSNEQTFQSLSKYNKNITANSTNFNIGGENLRVVSSDLNVTKTKKVSSDLNVNQTKTVSFDLNATKTVSSDLNVTKTHELHDKIKSEIKELHSENTTVKSNENSTYMQSEVTKYEAVNNEVVYVNYELPFKEGRISVVLNYHDPLVVSKLIELDAEVDITQPHVIFRVPADDGKKIKIRLNIDNTKVREVLKATAVSYSEVPSAEENNIVSYHMPFGQGAVEVVLNISDSEVISKLLNLSSQVSDSDDHTLIKIRTFGKPELDIKLNLDDSVVRTAVEGIALEYEVLWNSTQQFASNLQKHVVQSQSDNFTLTIDAKNKEVVQELRELSQKADHKKSLITIRTVLEDGSFLTLRLNPEDSETRQMLKKIVTDYDKIFNVHSDKSEGILEGAVHEKSNKTSDIHRVTRHESGIKVRSSKQSSNKNSIREGEKLGIIKASRKKETSGAKTTRLQLQKRKEQLIKKHKAKGENTFAKTSYKKGSKSTKSQSHKRKSKSSKSKAHKHDSETKASTSKQASLKDSNSKHKIKEENSSEKLETQHIVQASRNNETSVKGTTLQSYERTEISSNSTLLNAAPELNLEVNAGISLSAESGDSKMKISVQDK